MKLKDATDADLHSLRQQALELLGTPLEAALQEHIRKSASSYMSDLEDANTPGEKLKYAQGVIAQANRDILLVERFLESISRELELRKRREVRRT